MTAAQVKRKISRAFGRAFGTQRPSTISVIPTGDAIGKLYEAYVLATVAAELHTKEALQPVLVHGRKLTLKTAGSAVNRSYPYVRLLRQGQAVAELWTDVFVTTLGCSQRHTGGKPLPCDYHELDIVMVPPGTSGYPSYHVLSLAIECKATTYDKALLREILGVRRELSFLSGPTPTRFVSWPRAHVPASPPSCLLVFSTDAGVSQWQPAGDTFGIDFVHCPIR